MASKKSNGAKSTRRVKTQHTKAASASPSSDLNLAQYLLESLKLAFFDTSGVKQIASSKKALWFGLGLSMVGTLLTILWDKEAYPQGMTLMNIAQTSAIIFGALVFLTSLLNVVAKRFGAKTSFASLLTLLLATEMTTVLTAWYPFTGPFANWVVGLAMIWWIAVIAAIIQAHYELTLKQSISVVGIVVVATIAILVILAIIVAVLGSMGLFGAEFQQYVLSQ